VALPALQAHMQQLGWLILVMFFADHARQTLSACELCKGLA
jgi:hypothetical protein